MASCFYVRKIATDARSLKGIKDLACTLCNVSKTKQKLPMINMHGYNNHFKMYKTFQVSLFCNIFVDYCPVYTIFSNNSVYFISFRCKKYQHIRTYQSKSNRAKGRTLQFGSNGQILALDQ